MQLTFEPLVFELFYRPFLYTYLTVNLLIPCFTTLAVIHITNSSKEPLPVMTNEHTKEFLPSLRTPPSTYSRHVRYTLYEFPSLLDSSSISSSGWAQIALTI